MKLARNLAAEVPIATHLFLGLLQAPQQVCVCVEPSRASPGGGIFSPFSPPVCWHQCLVATTAASVRFPGGLGCRGALSSQGLGFFYLHYFFCVRVKTEGMGMCQSPVVCWFDRLRFPFATREQRCQEEVHPFALRRGFYRPMSPELPIIRHGKRLVSTSWACSAVFLSECRIELRRWESRVPRMMPCLTRCPTCCA